MSQPTDPKKPNFVEFHLRDITKSHPNYGSRIFIDINDICCAQDNLTRDDEKPYERGCKIYMKGHLPIEVTETLEEVLLKINIQLFFAPPGPLRK